MPATSAENSLQSVALDEEGTLFHSFGLPDGTMSSATNALDTTNQDLAASTVLPPVVNKDDATSLTSTSNPDAPKEYPAASIAVSPVANEDTRLQGGIVGLTQAIRDIERSVAESIAGSKSPSPSGPPSALPSPDPSPVLSTPASPVPSPAASPQRPVSGSVKRASAPLAPTGSKRHCATTSTPPSCIVPPDAPQWVASAINMFIGERFGDKWQELVAAWLVYEGRRNFSGNKLSPKGRPKIVADWIKWARKPTWRPSTLPKAEDLDREHVAWWRGLQPAWRMTGDGPLKRDGHGGWDSLHVGGVNGLLSALASMFYWRLTIRSGEGNTDRWDTTVDDTLYVVQQLTNNL